MTKQLKLTPKQSSLIRMIRHFSTIAELPITPKANLKKRLPTTQKPSSSIRIIFRRTTIAAWCMRTSAAIEQAIADFRKALELDPNKTARQIWKTISQIMENNLRDSFIIHFPFTRLDFRIHFARQHKPHHFVIGNERPERIFEGRRFVVFDEKMRNPGKSVADDKTKRKIIPGAAPTSQSSKTKRVVPAKCRIRVKGWLCSARKNPKIPRMFLFFLHSLFYLTVSDFRGDIELAISAETIIPPIPTAIITVHYCQRVIKRFLYQEFCEKKPAIENQRKK